MEPRDEAWWEWHDRNSGESCCGCRVSIATPGSGFSGLGAPKRQKTPWEDGCSIGMVFADQNKGAFGETAEILEGDRKAMSGTKLDRQLDSRLLVGIRQGPLRKEKGRRRSRNAKRTATAGSHTLKVNVTPRRVRVSRTWGAW